MNPMLSRLAQNSPAPAQQQSSNPMNMIQQFAEFKRQMAGKDPQAIVQQLLQSGQMSQQQFEQLKRQAISLQQILR